MVTIVTGKINSNKTSLMIQHHHEQGIGDGFVSVKNMIGDTVHSYDAMQLTSKEKQLLIKRDIFFENDFTIACSIGPYLFSEETLLHIEQKVEAMLNENVPAIYLDEVGVLELENKGFDKIIKEVLSNKTNLIIAVREDLVQAIVAHYGINDYQLIPAKLP